MLAHFVLFTKESYTTDSGRFLGGSWAVPGRFLGGSGGRTPAHENTTRTLRYRSREPETPRTRERRRRSDGRTAAGLASLASVGRRRPRLRSDGRTAAGLASLASVGRRRPRLRLGRADGQTDGRNGRRQGSLRSPRSVGGGLGSASVGHGFGAATQY